MVSVVYASSVEFAQVLLVSVTSLLSNKKPETEYNVYVLVERPFPKEIAGLFTELFKKNPGCRLNWIEMGDRFKRTLVDAAGVGKESNYRLALPEILQEDRCIYLDADTLVLKDLTSFYEFDITGFFLAGIHPNYFLNKVTEGYSHAHFDFYGKLITKFAGELRYDQYIGAGVMLMNLSLLRDQDMSRRFYREIPLRSGPLDQDILNACCYGKIKDLPVEYCVDLHDTEDISWYDANMPEKAALIHQAIDAPCVIHFSDRYKPWRRMGVRFEKNWWYYAFISEAADVLWNEFRNRCNIPQDFYEKKYNTVINSLSYKVGRAITYIPRKIINRRRY